MDHFQKFHYRKYLWLASSFSEQYYNIPEQWKHQNNVGNKFQNLTVKTPERGQRHCFGALFVNFGKVWRIALMLLSMFLNNKCRLSRLTTRPFKKFPSIFAAALYRKVLGLIPENISHLFFHNSMRFAEIIALLALPHPCWKNRYEYNNFRKIFKSYIKIC